jgi:hypothetical protein
MGLFVRYFLFHEYWEIYCCFISMYICSYCAGFLGACLIYACCKCRLMVFLELRITMSLILKLGRLMVFLDLRI